MQSYTVAGTSFGIELSNTSDNALGWTVEYEVNHKPASVGLFTAATISADKRKAERHAERLGLSDFSVDLAKMQKRLAAIGAVEQMEVA